MPAISSTFLVCAAAHDGPWVFNTFETSFQLHITRALEHEAVRYFSMRFEPQHGAQNPKLYINQHAAVEIFYWNGTDYVPGQIVPL